MKRKTFLPNLPLLGEEGSWTTIRDIVQNRLLPKVEAMGDKFFAHSLLPLPKEATIVPIVSETWSRPRRDGTPQFLFVVSGTGMMLVENHLLSLTTHQGVYLAKEVLYAPYLRLGEQILPCDWLWFKIHPFGVVVLRAKLTPTAHYQSAHFVVAERRLADLFGEWERERLQPQPNPHLTKALLVALFGLLTRLTPFPPPEPQELSSRVQSNDLPTPLQCALVALQRAYNKPLNLNQLAAYCAVTPAYLCRLFRKHLGITPWEYLKRLRLRVAYYLLRETNLSVADVAFLAGFNDMRHFHRLFRQTFQSTPTEIRRKRVRRPSLLRVWD